MSPIAKLSKASIVRTFGHRGYEVTLKHHEHGQKTNIEIGGLGTKYAFAVLGIKDMEILQAIGQTYVDGVINHESKKF